MIKYHLTSLFLVHLVLLLVLFNCSDVLNPIPIAVLRGGWVLL